MNLFQSLVQLEMVTSCCALERIHVKFKHQKATVFTPAGSKVQIEVVHLCVHIKRYMNLYHSSSQLFLVSRARFDKKLFRLEE